ncbi:MAG: hypothetical protein A2Y10_04790 [Planctomycetes bacterium GWF2_41_51]|nr:MAG: hypothetical protein A2Y10_04790 [Planctomycetes bacterium GWF2_41_51]HBG26687.1 hypothetical protein [Phycisphaerales bacterium]
MNENKIECYVGEQLYSDIDLNTDKSKKTTFEKMILNKTTELKTLYIDSYNTLKDRDEPARIDMDFEHLYKKMCDEKAVIAQEAAGKLSEINLGIEALCKKIQFENDILRHDEVKVKAESIVGKKPIIKREIEENLEYIVKAIKFVIPDL